MMGSQLKYQKCPIFFSFWGCGKFNFHSSSVIPFNKPHNILKVVHIDSTKSCGEYSLPESNFGNHIKGLHGCVQGYGGRICFGLLLRSKIGIQRLPDHYGRNELSYLFQGKLEC